jgi:hypothetical protein
MAKGLPRLNMVKGVCGGTETSFSGVRAYFHVGTSIQPIEDKKEGRASDNNGIVGSI